MKTIQALEQLHNKRFKFGDATAIVKYEPSCKIPLEGETTVRQTLEVVIVGKNIMERFSYDICPDDVQGSLHRFAGVLSTVAEKANNGI